MMNIGTGAIPGLYADEGRRRGSVRGRVGSTVVTRKERQSSTHFSRLVVSVEGTTSPWVNSFFPRA